MIYFHGHWQYPVDIDISEWFGFVYRIIEVDTGKEYIGKKQFFSHTRKKIANRKNRKKIIKESEWQSYTGSSKKLNEHIDNFGKDSYKFFIESLHETRGSLYYSEIETQIKEDVLRATLDDGITPRYYNRFISAVKFIPPLPTLKEKNYNIRNYQLTENIQKPDKILTYEDYYGISNVEQFKYNLDNFKIQ